MLKKIVLAGSAALALSLVAAPSAFAAAPWNGGYNNGNWQGNGNYNGGNFQPPQQCTPVTQTFRWWDRSGHVHFYTKVVAQNCVPVAPPHPPFHSHGWGWGGGW